MVVIVMHMVIIPTVVHVHLHNGMVLTVSLTTPYPHVLVLPVPIMVPAIPMVPTTSTVIVVMVSMENNVNMFNLVRASHNHVEIVVHVLIMVGVIIAIVKWVIMGRIVKATRNSPNVHLIHVEMGGHVMTITPITRVCVPQDFMEPIVNGKVIMCALCTHVTMVEHVTVRDMVHTIVCALPAIPVVNVKHSSTTTIISVRIPIRVTMVARVCHRGPLILILVIVRGVIRAYNVKLVSHPPMVVTLLPAIMVVPACQ